MDWLNLFSAQRNALVLRFASLVLPSVLVSACVYVPPVWDAYDEIGYVGSIEQGVTTRSEVVEKLGEPHRKYDYKGEEFDEYEGTASAGFMCIGGGYQARCGLISEDPWWVRIYYDEKDVVARVATSEEPVKELTTESLMTRAKEGDSNAQLQLYYRGERDASTFRWLCLAGHSGNGRAQEELGDVHTSPRPSDLKWRSVGIVELDLVRGYVWYSLAVSNGQKLAPLFRDQLRRRMAPSEITEAERLVKEWKPHQEECEREAQPRQVSG